MPSASGPVVSYRNSTSNHNVATSGISAFLLYLIEILHQTTTCRLLDRWSPLLYLIEILHQTTTLPEASLPAVWLYLIEILHQTTTGLVSMKKDLGCILSKFYIKPQLEVVHCLETRRCILSKFYIKPQHSGLQVNHIKLYLIEILHQTTTFWTTSKSY